jgi:hypothetical protein
MQPWDFNTARPLLIICGIGLASCAEAAASPRTPVNPFVTVQQIAADAHGFVIRDVVPVRVPTSMTPGKSCLASDEYATGCGHTSYHDYRDAYRVEVSYDSATTELVSDEYPHGNNWTTDFVLPVEALDARAVAAARAVSGTKRVSALQSLAGLEATTLAVDRDVLVKECPSELVWETEWRHIDPNCKDEVSTRRTAIPALRIVPRADAGRSGGGRAITP